MKTDRGENFIPWAQIRPLLKPGMSGAELDRQILERLGLSDESHVLVCYASRSLSLSEALKAGLHVEPRSSHLYDWTADRWRTEPVR